MAEVESTSPSPEQLEPPVSLRELDGFAADLADLAEMANEVQFDPTGKLETDIADIAPKEAPRWPDELAGVPPEDQHSAVFVDGEIFVSGKAATYKDNEK